MTATASTSATPASAEAPVAIVTGGAAGIGWEIGRRLAAGGYRVVAADLVPGLTETEPVDGIVHRRLDVTDPGDVAAVFDGAVAEFGRLDAVVNNAGIQRHRAIEDLAWEEWKAVVDVNLHGVFLCLQAAGRHMLAAGGGRIVNISSISSRGSAGRAPYASTKAAVIGLTATAGAEVPEGDVHHPQRAPDQADAADDRAAAVGALPQRRRVQLAALHVRGDQALDDIRHRRLAGERVGEAGRAVLLDAHGRVLPPGDGHRAEPQRFAQRQGDGRRADRAGRPAGHGFGTEASGTP